jgi:hypothetical protein
LNQFCSNNLNIFTRSHVSSHFLTVLAELKPTPNRTNLAAQSKYVYMTQEAIKTRKTSKNETAMIVSRVAIESIRNMNETEDSNKNINEIWKTQIYCKKWKQRKESNFQKLTQNRLVYDELCLNLESKVNDIQLS